MNEATLAIHKFVQELDSHTLDLDKISTLDDYDELLAQSQRCLKNQVDYNTRERVMHSKLRELVALEDEIMANHASELEGLSPHVRDALAARLQSISNIRLSCLKTYWHDVSKGSEANRE